MRLLAYDFEALVRMAQQAPWSDGLEEARLWAGDVRRAAAPETGFGHDAGTARVFDVALVDAVTLRLLKVHEALGGKKPLLELLGDDPAPEVLPGVDGWRIYEDLTRLWTTLVSPRFADADLVGASGLLGALGDATGRDLRLERTAPLCRGIGMPYPIRWCGKPRARIYHATGEALDAMCEISGEDVTRAATTLGRPREQVAAQVGTLIRHFELARQLDTVVAIDSDDAFWS